MKRQEVGKGTNELMSNCQENKKQQENEEELLYDNEKYIHTQNIRTKRGNDDKTWREKKEKKKNKYCDRFVAVNQGYATIMCINFTTDTFYALLVYDNSRARSFTSVSN